MRKKTVFGMLAAVTMMCCSTTAIGQECVSNEGLVGWWPGDGNALDVHGGQDGTNVGGVSYTTGKCGQAFDFNGSNFIDVPVLIGDPLDLGGVNDAITMVCWLKPRGTGTMHVIGKRSGCSGGLPFYQLPINHGVLYLPVGTWAHVVLSWNNATGTFKTYKNGVLLRTLTDYYITKSTGSFRIGTSGECRPYDGLIDEVMIFNRALSDDEVAILASTDCPNICDPNTPPVITCSDPAVLWEPNHELIDISGNLFTVDDVDGDAVVVTVRVVSDESEVPETGDGTGRFAPDYKPQLADGTFGFFLRSERQGRGNGRVYLAIITAYDGTETVTKTCILAVTPHDQNDESLAQVLVEADLRIVELQTAVESAGTGSVDLNSIGLIEHGLSSSMGNKQ